MKFIALLLLFFSALLIADEAEQFKLFIEGNTEGMQEQMFKGDALELARTIRVVEALGKQDIDEIRKLTIYIVEAQILGMWRILESVEENPWLANELISGLNRYQDFYEAHGFSGLGSLVPVSEREEELEQIYRQLPFPLRETESYLSPSEKISQAIEYLSEH